MTAMAGFVILAAFLLAVGTGKWEDILLESGRSEVTQDIEIPAVTQDVQIDMAQDVEVPAVQ